MRRNFSQLSPNGCAARRMWGRFRANQEGHGINDHLGGLESVHQLNDSLQLLPLGLVLLLLHDVRRHCPSFSALRRFGQIPLAGFVGEAVDWRPRALALFAVYFHLWERKPSISKRSQFLVPITSNQEPHFVGGACRRAPLGGVSQVS